MNWYRRFRRKLSHSIANTTQLDAIHRFFFYRMKKHRYHLIDTGLPRGYYDIDVRMLHGCFALLCGYIEIECEGEAELEKFTNELAEQHEGWQVHF